jgi:hypothetical protein
MSGLHVLLGDHLRPHLMAGRRHAIRCGSAAWRAPTCAPCCIAARAASPVLTPDTSCCASASCRLKSALPASGPCCCQPWVVRAPGVVRARGQNGARMQRTIHAHLARHARDRGSEAVTRSSAAYRARVYCRPQATGCQRGARQTPAFQGGGSQPRARSNPLSGWSRLVSVVAGHCCSLLSGDRHARSLLVHRALCWPYWQRRLVSSRGGRQVWARRAAIMDLQLPLPPSARRWLQACGVSGLRDLQDALDSGEGLWRRLGSCMREAAWHAMRDVHHPTPCMLPP